MRRALLLGLPVLGALAATGLFVAEKSDRPVERPVATPEAAAPEAAAQQGSTAQSRPPASGDGRAVGAAAPEAEPETGKKPPWPAGQDKVVARMHAYLDQRLEAAAAERERYWRSLRDANGTVDRARARRDLGRLLRVPDNCLDDQSAAAADRREVARLSEGMIERITLEVCRGELLALGLIGWPDAAAAVPLVVAFHGTSTTPENVFGIDDPAELDVPDYQHRFGRALMAKGFAVFAPLLLTETKADPRTGYNGTRNTMNRRALPLGAGMNGMQIGMVMSAAGFILRDDRIERGRIGAYGISHGGQLAFYFAALDRRVSATVVSQWIEAREAKLSGASHADALWRYPSAAHNLYPDILRHFTDVETASLIAPRGLFVEAGRRDGERARGAERVFPRILETYARLGAPPGAACLDLVDAGHEIIMHAADEFLDYWLRGSGGSDLGSFCPRPAPAPAAANEPSR
jgi:dienelactone hydrolase